MIVLSVIFTVTWSLVSGGVLYEYEDALDDYWNVDLWGANDNEKDFYDEDHNDQKYWNDEFILCKMKQQSPIDIDSTYVTHVNLPPLKMTGFDTSSATTLINSGHTAQLTINSEIKPTLSGGPLNAKYEFAQLHFHWGDNDNIGSERAISGKKFPIELHVVFYNTAYGDANSAMNHSDGFCVLSCLFELQDDDNENYNALVTTLGQITEPHTSTDIVDPPTLFELLPLDLCNYHTYSGSLTTPPYPEIVIWIDFDNTVKISHSQLQLFRSLTDEEGHPMVNNFRPIQPTGDRDIFYNALDCSIRY